VSNSLGEIIMSYNEPVKVGANNVTVTGIKQAGMYYVTVRLKNTTYSEKFIKQ
jgi:hypothetical protein